MICGGTNIYLVEITNKIGLHLRKLGWGSVVFFFFRYQNMFSIRCHLGKSNVLEALWVGSKRCPQSHQVQKQASNYVDRCTRINMEVNLSKRLTYERRSIPYIFVRRRSNVWRKTRSHITLIQSMLIWWISEVNKQFFFNVLKI